jgi:putative molybdopterin biosynthesis protein
VANPNTLRDTRIARGMTQSGLARRAAISRQALGAIEAGAYQPSVAVALRLARELGQTVETLFAESAGQASRQIEARWSDAPGSSGTGVVLGRVGGRIVAVSQPAAGLALAPPAGIVARANRARTRVSTWRSPDEIDSTLLIAGCDPAVAMLRDWLARQRSPICAAALPYSSTRALEALLDGRAHAAGIHLRDPQSDEYNLGAVRRALGRRAAILVNFARWELGFAVAHGNRLGIRGVADLARRRVRLANRERGSGARCALDDAVTELGLRADSISGYAREFGGHLEVAAAIAAGAADAGVTLRVAALAYGLEFIPLREERYDLAILAPEAESPPVNAMFEALNSRRFAREVSQFCAYDTGQMGQVIGRLN